MGQSFGHQRDTPSNLRDLLQLSRLLPWGPSLGSMKKQGVRVGCALSGSPGATQLPSPLTRLCFCAKGALSYIKTASQSSCVNKQIHQVNRYRTKAFSPNAASVHQLRVLSRTRLTVKMLTPYLKGSLWPRIS